jgi:hypothetical protein
MSGIMTTDKELRQRAYERFSSLKASLNQTHLDKNTRHLIKKSVKRYERDNEETRECIGEIEQVGIIDNDGDDSLTKMMNKFRRSEGVSGPSICYSYTLTDAEYESNDARSLKCDDGVLTAYWDIEKYTFAVAMKKAKKAQAARIHEYFYKTDYNKEVVVD